MIAAVTVIPAVGIIVDGRLFMSGALTPRTALLATVCGRRARSSLNYSGSCASIRQGTTDAAMF
jgi:hypothetical protein